MKKSLLYALFIFCSFGTLKSQTVVTFYTTLGDFEVELFDDLKPITAGNFLDLVEQEFYDGVIFHRVISNFVIQGGDPTGTGSGGPGYTIDDEFDPSLSNLERTLSMANSGPNTGGSQFFINLKDNIFLDFDNAPTSSAHPVFGEVITGWEIVEIIEDVPVNANDRPINPVIMDSIRVTQPILGLSDIKTNDYSFNIQPNPITNQSVIEINSTNANMAEFSIFNLNGILIERKKIEVNQGLTKINMTEFDIDNLANGVYFMKLNSKNNSAHKRFLILN